MFLKWTKYVSSNNEFSLNYCRQRFGFRGWLYARMWGYSIANGQWLLIVFDVSMAQFQWI